MDRRAFLGLAAPATVGALYAPAAVAANWAGPDVRRVEQALAAFRRLPGRTSYVLQVRPAGRPWRSAHKPNARLFVGSAIKTFILTKYLQDVEAGRLSEGEQRTIDDAVRSLSSPVFLDLAGTTPARSVLEAMITHSDNTATDMALSQVGADRVRAFLERAGLTTAQIPDSTRTMISYFAGAPYGVDVGWAGMQQIAAGKLFGRSRSPMNDRETMKCSADQFVTYYEHALAGRYLKTDAALTEFKRIQAMADAISRVVPAGIAAYAKGGSVEWGGFNAVCLPGQMVIGTTVPATFCFTYNWNGPESTIPEHMANFGAALADVLQRTAEAFG